MNLNVKISDELSWKLKTMAAQRGLKIPEMIEKLIQEKEIPGYKPEEEKGLV